MMDPHSKARSPFNYRTPKSGPQVHKYMDVIPKSTRKPDFPPKRGSSSGSRASSLSVQRPIASNSRIKNNEKYRKDVFTSFINDALDKRLAGITGPFDQLVAEFDPKQHAQSGEGSQPKLRLWLSALSHVVSRLERLHASLVQAVVGMPWTTMESATVKAYTIFVGMLVSARPEYLSLVLGKIASGMTYQFGIRTTSTLKGQCSDYGLSNDPVTRRTVYDRQHYLLQHLLSLIPTLSTTLLPFLVENFPHKRQKEIAQTTYIRNLLRISNYCPEISGSILGTIIDRAIRIDVEIQVEVEELEEAEAASDQPMSQEAVFEFDPFDSLVGQDDSSSTSSDEEEDDLEDDDFGSLSSDEDEDIDETTDKGLPMNIGHIRDMVQKLDAILLIVFDYLQRLHQPPDTQKPEETTVLAELPPLPPLASSLTSHRSSNSIVSFFDIPDPPTPSKVPSSPFPSITAPCQNVRQDQATLSSHYHTLLSLFDRLLLPTFKSRYTQFLLFQSAALSSTFADLFQGLLLDRALYQENVPAIQRAAATSYIASLVSRAQFIGRDTTRTVAGVLCNYISNRITPVERSDGSISGQDIPTLYAVIQAVFLVFCFRWRELLDHEEVVEATELSLPARRQKTWMPELNIIQRAITSPLNPLKVCSQNVVLQFARVAHATDFVYCYSIIESNKRFTTALAHSSSKSTMTDNTVVPPTLNDALVEITTELNTFFPFDPYRLQRSGKYIQDFYREWGEVAIGDDDESSDDGPPSLANHGIELQREKIAVPQGEQDLDLDQSLEAMSISPVRRPGRLKG